MQDMMSNENTWFFGLSPEEWKQSSEHKMSEAQEAADDLLDRAIKALKHVHSLWGLS